MSPDDTTLLDGGPAAIIRPARLWGLWAVTYLRPYGCWLSHTWNAGDLADAPMAWASRAAALKQFRVERRETLDPGELLTVALLGVAPTPEELRGWRPVPILSPLRFGDADCTRALDPVPPAPPASLYGLWLRPAGEDGGDWLGHGHGGSRRDVMTFINIDDALATRDVESGDLGEGDLLAAALIAVAPAV